MFEQITIRRHERQAGRTQIDIGLLAETLLFYGNVHLLMDGAVLQSLLTTLGPEQLLTLMREKKISATYLSDILGVVTTTTGPIAYHKLSAFRVSADKNNNRITSQDDVLRAFNHTLGKSKSTRRFAVDFLSLAELRPHEIVRHLPDGSVVRVDDLGITGQAEADITDIRYLHAAIETDLRHEVPGYDVPKNWQLDVLKTPNGYVVSTTLDLQAINREYHKCIAPAENSITVAWLLGQMLQARADLYFAADYMSEFVTDPTSSALARLRVNDTFRRRNKSAAMIETFQDVELKNSTAIREAINSGDRTFEEFVQLLNRADKFKHWLHGQNPDVDLASSYYREVTKETWAERLPPKASRFVFFALAGLGLEQVLPGGVGAGIGVAANAVDQFLVDKILRGWRPNQFVNGPLMRFVDRA